MSKYVITFSTSLQEHYLKGQYTKYKAEKFPESSIQRIYDFIPHTSFRQQPYFDNDDAYCHICHTTISTIMICTIMCYAICFIQEL